MAKGHIKITRHDYGYAAQSMDKGGEMFMREERPAEKLSEFQKRALEAGMVIILGENVPAFEVLT